MSMYDPVGGFSKWRSSLSLGLHPEGMQERPSRHPIRTPRILILVVLAAAFAGLFIVDVVRSHRPEFSTQLSRLRCPSSTDPASCYQLVVTNTGGEPGTPRCTIASDPSPTEFGDGTNSHEADAPVEPGDGLQQVVIVRPNLDGAMLRPRVSCEPV